MNIRILWIAVLLCTPLGILHAQRDAQDIEFRDIKLVETRHDGAQGIGVSGRIGLWDYQGNTRSMMHKELQVEVLDASGNRVFLSEKLDGDYFYDVWQFYPNAADMLKAGHSRDNRQKVLFFSYSQLGLPEGSQKVSFRFRVSDVFEDDELLRSDKYSIEVVVPQIRPFWVEWGGKPDTALWPNDGEWFVEGAGATKLRGKPYASGWVRLVEGDDLRIGVTSVKEGHTSGFRLFKIQITRGRSYTYLDEFAATEWRMDTLWTQAKQERTVRLSPNEGKGVIEGHLKLFTWDYWLAHENPFGKMENVVVSQGGKGGPANGGSNSDSLYVWMPLSCGATAGRASRFHHVLHGVGEDDILSQGKFRYGCGQWITDDYRDQLLFPEMLSVPFFWMTPRTLAVGDETYMEFALSLKQWSRLKEQGEWQGPIRLSLWVSNEWEEGKEWKKEIGTVEIPESHVQDWESAQTLRMWMWIIGGIVLMAAFAGWIVWMVRRAKSAMVTNIRVG